MSRDNITIARKTTETDIALQFGIDGTGSATLETEVPFLNHMLDLFTKHGQFDLDLKLNGDIDVDYHHSVEDVGICLGQAFRKAIDSAKGIHRYASGLVPMDESLCEIAIDISNRPFLHYAVPPIQPKVGTFDTELTEEFLRALTQQAGLTLHMDIVRGKNSHHICESGFKALGIVLDQATKLDSRHTNVPSTKGIL